MDILSLERRALAAWPALTVETIGGWVFRSAAGCTKRANSANALTPSLPFERIRGEAEAYYARHCLPTIFRVTPLADVDDELARAGYDLRDPSIVMTAPLTAARPSGKVRIDTSPSPAWLSGIAAANGLTAAMRPAHDAIVGAIAAPAAFAALDDGGSPIGFGLAVCDQGMVGLFDIVVAPDQRGRGHGRAITTALLHWGRQAGARSAYLQVRDGNAAALALYADLGFTEAYRYHYRIAPGGIARD